MNGEYEDPVGQVTEIGKLMHDFRCSEPSKMLIPEIREASRIFKETPEGVREMCAEIDKMREAVATAAAKRASEQKEAEVNERVARDMLTEGEPLSKIMKFSRLSEEAVRKLASTLDTF